MGNLPTYAMLKHTFQCYIVLLITYGLARADIQSLPLEFNTCPPSSVSIPALYENITVGTVLARFRNIANFTINTEDYFRVEKNGNGFYLKIKHPLDYETKPIISVDFHCKAKKEDSFLDYDNEIINVEDVLETAPQFNQRKYNISVDENMAEGKELQLEIYVTVENIAGGSLGLNLSGTDVFAISKVTQAEQSQRGVRYKVGILLKRALDYDKGPPHTVSFTLNATIKDHPKFANSSSIEVDIKDVDDQNPEFTHKTYNCSIKERSTSFQWATEKPVAYDLDKTINETIGYDLVGGDGGHLKIDNNTGSLTIIKQFDREKKDFYAVTILAYQIDQPLFRRDVAILYITVLDVNDHSPVMAKSRYTASIAENTPNGTVIISLGAIDLDTGANSMFIYKMKGTHASLGLNETSGQIFVQNSEKLDYETTHLINFTVFAQENLTQKHLKSNTANVTIRLTDENDNNPIFSQPNGYHVSCNKTKQVGSRLLQINASDKDDSENGLITFQLKGDSKFRIDSKTGIIFLNQSLEKNFKHEYFLDVTATDNAVIQAARRETSTIVTVHVKDVNIHSPMFTFPKANGTISLTEAFTPGLVFELKAHDDDPDDNLTFTINTNDFFHIKKDGTLLLNKMMDREKQEFIPITVSVTDGLHKAVLKLKINVSDVNDNAPYFTTAEYRFSAVEENKTNAFVGQVKALDRDSGINSDVTCQVIGQWRDNFTITENGTLFTRGRLDRENLGDDGVIYLTVLAKDHGIPSMNNTVTVQVTVEDVNDHIPIFTSHSKTFYLDEGYYNIFKPFYTASATDRDVNGIILYAIKEDRHNAFRINNITGALYITKQLNISSSDDCSVAVVIEAYNSKPYVINGDNDTMLVEVEIQDTNNHAPIFRGSPYQFSIKESEKMGYILGTMNATDLDTEYINNHVIYEITNGNEDGKFYMDREKGYIILMGKVDFEKRNQYILTISARNCVPLYNKSPSAVYDTVAINIIKDHWSHTNKKCKCNYVLY